MVKARFLLLGFIRKNKGREMSNAADVIILYDTNYIEKCKPYEIMVDLAPGNLIQIERIWVRYKKPEEIPDYCKELEKEVKE